MMFSIEVSGGADRDRLREDGRVGKIDGDLNVKMPIPIFKKTLESLLQYAEDSGCSILKKEDEHWACYMIDHPHYGNTPLAESLFDGQRWKHWMFIRL